MVTRAQVAQRAGVSPAVVSYVINGGPRGVSDEARARVQRAIEELNYRPNGVARALRMSATSTIGLIVPNQTNDYFAELTEHIEAQAFAHGYLLLVGITHDDLDRERRYVESFVDRRVDGLLVISGRAGELIAQEVRRTPVVAVDRAAELASASNVSVDNRAGAAIATEHLQSHGLTVIACVAGPGDIRLAAEREQGWREQLGLAQGEEDLVAREDFSTAGGYRAWTALLARPRIARALAAKVRIGVFASSDAQARGIYQACAERGLRIPEDITIVSFDGSAAGLHLAPPLTSYCQPTERIAVAATNELVRRITQPDAAPESTMITGHLRHGASCGCPSILA